MDKAEASGHIRQFESPLNRVTEVLTLHLGEKRYLRLSHLTITMPGGCSEDYVEETDEPPWSSLFPFLVTLKVYSPHGYPWLSLPMPSVRFLTLLSPHHKSKPGWRRLSKSRFLDILALFPSLEELRAESQFGFLPEEEPLAPLVLPHLRKLSLEFEGEKQSRPGLQAIFGILDLLEAPMLESFRFDLQSVFDESEYSDITWSEFGRLNEDAANLIAIRNFLDRSQCSRSITHLQLNLSYGCPISDQGFVALLHLVPNVIDLHLAFPQSMYTPLSTGTWPKLECLDLKLSPKSIHHLKEILQSLNKFCEGHQETRLRFGIDKRLAEVSIDDHATVLVEAGFEAVGNTWMCGRS
jgi:hypothetical protein